MANLMGLADKNFQDQLSIVNAGTAASHIIDTRDYITASIGDTTITNTDLDASTLLLQAFRGKESSLSYEVNSIISSLLSSINTYYTTVTAKTMRNYYDCKSTATTIDFVSSGTAFTTGLTAFRKMYSRTQNQELIYKAYYCKQTVVADTTYNVGSGVTAYGFTSDFTSSAFEVRLATKVTNSTSLTVTGVLETGNSTSVTVTVGAGTSYSDVVTNQKFISLSSLGLGTSLSGNTVEIWTR
jgi:hypothetical protein